MDSQRFLNWFVWIMIGVTAILFLLKIFGDSPTIEQMFIGTFVTFLVAIYKELIDIKGKTGEHSTELKHTNQQIAEIKQELKNHKH